MLSEIHTLSSLSAPQRTFGTRGLPSATRVRDETFWDSYDNDTLIYDCVALQNRGLVRLFMPKLLNFKDTMLSAQILIDGIPAKRRRFTENLKFDILDFHSNTSAKEIAINTRCTKISVAINPSNPSRYAGRNVLYTQVKNDDLKWIYDWGVAHQRNHGVDSILVTNNGSNAYSSEDLRQTLAQIPGLSVADVLEVPQSHGARPTTCNGAGATKFLQPALLNLVRDRFFHDARAVLLCDIDELVQSPARQSIFDATVGSTLKYKTFYGVWRYAQNEGSSISHSDHVLARGTDKKCASKYCVVPQSLLGRMTWGVHSLEKINRHIFRPFNSFSFIHCRQISTSWKVDRTARPNTTLYVDAQTRKFMADTFSRS